MKTRTLFAWCVSLIGLVPVGCSPQKQSTPAASTNAPAAPAGAPVPATNQPSAGANPLTAPVDYLGAVAKAKRVAEKTVDLASLNRSIQLFEAQEERFPRDLNELVAMRYLPALPAAPLGMRINYNPRNGQVSLVKQ